MKSKNHIDNLISSFSKNFDKKLVDLIPKKKISSKVKIYPKPAVKNANFRNQFFFHLRLIISEYFKVIYTIIFIR